jgi:hypothetical protein
MSAIINFLNDLHNNSTVIFKNKNLTYLYINTAINISILLYMIYEILYWYWFYKNKGDIYWKTNTMITLIFNIFFIFTVIYTLYNSNPIYFKNLFININKYLAFFRPSLIPNPIPNPIPTPIVFI